MPNSDQSQSNTNSTQPNELPKKKIAKIVIDRNLCIGAASCMAVAPQVFELDQENKAVLRQKNSVKNSGPSPVDALEDSTIDQETLRMAAQSCPTRAILLYDEEENQIYP